jgi:hypothetical protein
MQMIKRYLIPLAGMLLVPAALTPAAAAEPSGGRPGGSDYSRPSPPRDVADGTFLGAVGAGLRLVRVEDPAGAPGCEGAPRPDLRAVTAGGGEGDLFDPAPQVTLSAGGNTVLANGGHVAIATFCEGYLDQVWLATATGTSLTAVRALPARNPSPSGQFLITHLSRDGRRLLAVSTTGSSLGEHRTVAVDTTSGIVTDLGVPGYWAGELADGTLVVDQGDRLRIGATTVAVPNPPGAGRFLTISPDGRRVAFANTTGLFVVERDGTTRRWSTEAVLGRPAWSPDGVALAYPTGPADALAGALRVVTAGTPPRTAIPAVVTFTPVGFAADRSVTALLATVPGSDPGDPGTGRVTEVTFPGRRSGALPTTPVAYAEATFAAWQSQDTARLQRLAQPADAALLIARHPQPGETWTGPACEGAAGSSYCTWTTPTASLTIRVGNEAASQGHDHAVTEAFFDPPPGGVALWPLITAAEAANTQHQVDQGHSPWMLDPAAVADSFARAVLGWSEVDVTVEGPSAVRVADAGGTAAVELGVAQPARTGPGGIWVVIRAGSAP